MFSIFSIIKQFIFFIVIFISFHFTYNYFRNLFLSKQNILTSNEKYDEINEILQNSNTKNNETLPSTTLTEPTKSEIQTLEKEIEENINETTHISLDETYHNELISPIENACSETQTIISSIDY